MSERPDPSVFEEPAHQPASSDDLRDGDVSKEPAHGDFGAPDDPRDAPGHEPALAWADNLPNYGEVYADLRADTTKVEFRSAVIVAGGLAFISGIVLIPVLAAGSVLWGPWAVVALLGAPTLALVERRPWQVSSASVPMSVPLITTIPMWLLAVVLGQFSDVGRLPSLLFAAFLTGGAAVLGLGLTRIWRRAHYQAEPPTVRPLLPYGAAAVALVFVGMVVTVFIVI